MRKSKETEACHKIELCPKFEAAFEILSKRWAGLIIKSLLDGPKRFKEIAAFIPNMSDRMLVERFKELEAVGIIARNVYPEVPVRIVYELTEKGKAFKPVMEEIEKWAEAWE